MITVKKNLLEWTVFAASLVLVLTVIGYLTYEAVTTGDNPPRIIVSSGKAHEWNGLYRVPIAAQNLGDQTAEGVMIEVTLEGGGETETGEVAFAFLPRRSRREGWASFTRNPKTGKITARVRGYESP
jgi:uncharacterized protein (TIGR02588 family)